jgi:SAM-dependent methyltransferase
MVRAMTIVGIKLALESELRRKVQTILASHPRLEKLFWRFWAIYERGLRLIGVEPRQWARVVMDREIEQFVRSLKGHSLRALEISGNRWETWGFRAYQNTSFPAYDVCEKPLEREAFDIIFAEQILEHVLWPRRAASNLWTMLRPGGMLVVNTPFLIRVHEFPVDCSRWTELGLRYLLVEAGFDLGSIRTGSWGNRACVRANFWGWRRWIRWLHSLRNEPGFPVVVWAIAEKKRQLDDSETTRPRERAV